MPTIHLRARAHSRAEFIIPAEAAEMYWEANTRKVYRFLTDKDVKSSLKDTTVYILWPKDGVWYVAEIEQVRGICNRSHHHQSPAASSVGQSMPETAAVIGPNRWV